MGRFNITARRRANREAQRRWYARQKKCEALYREVRAGPRVLDMLVKRGYILDSEVGDAHEVCEAISLFMLDHAEADTP
jgi:hypothetical protein